MYTFSVLHVLNRGLKLTEARAIFCYPFDSCFACITKFGAARDNIVCDPSNIMYHVSCIPLC